MLPTFMWTRGGLVEWLCSGLQIRVHRFDSGTRLQALLYPLFLYKLDYLTYKWDTGWDTDSIR